jgi:ABC-type sugar transport system ATPase subunit
MEVNMEEIILEMKDVTKNFPGVLALDKAHIDIKKGEVHILVGENGAGKSTLVKILAGAYSKDSGEIIYKGKLVENLTPKYAQELGLSIIYQEFNLITYLSVAENIFLGREIFSSKIPGKMAINRACAFNRAMSTGSSDCQSRSTRARARASSRSLSIKIRVASITLRIDLVIFRMGSKKADRRDLGPILQGN